MQYTSNLNLKKPDSTDYVNIADLNENMDVLDEAVSDLQNGTSEIPDLQTTDKKLAGAINEVNAKVTKHLADEMPHKFTNTTTGKKYKYGLGVDSGGIYIISEEVV